MKNIIFVIIGIIISSNCYAENIKNLTLNELLKNDYKIDEKNAATGYVDQDYIYFILENDDSEIVICKVPGTIFFDKTLCKKP